MIGRSAPRANRGRREHAAIALSVIAIAIGASLDGTSALEIASALAALGCGVGAALIARRVPFLFRSAEVERAIDSLRERVEAAVKAAQQTRSAAEEAQRDADEFLSAVSHELRTPLNSIQGFSQVLLAEIDGPLTSSQREDLEAVHAAGEHLKQLIDEVLDVAGGGPSAARIAEVDLAALVREVARWVEPQKGEREIDLQVDVPGELPAIRGDRRRVRQILINLASNAIKYTERGHVRITCRAHEGSVRVAVEDTGPGISPQDQTRVFRAYERVEARQGRTEGWGLGLAIAREMAEWHGGRIELASEVGRGSTFTLVLPIEGPREEEPR